jgi:hypothetical protein
MVTRMAKPIDIRTPRTDDRSLSDLWAGLYGYPAVLVANRLRLFDLLADKPLSLEEVCAAKEITRRPAEAVLSVCTSLGLMSLREGKYSLTPISEDYLISSSPTYYGWYWDFLSLLSTVWSPEQLFKAVMTDRPQGPFSDPTGAFAAWHADQAVNFTRAMHSVSITPALEWPKAIDLSVHRTMLDIGGGSGAHAIGAASISPKLKAIVLDQEPICAIAREFADRYGVSDRISTYAADFFKDPYPEADLHFYGMIFHDWPLDRCRLLARKSFESLPPSGRIIIHDVLFNEDRTGPFPAAALNIAMLEAMPGQQYSGSEITQMLQEAGFTTSR